MSLKNSDTDELLVVLQAYYRLFTGRDLVVTRHKGDWIEDRGKYISFS